MGRHLRLPRARFESKAKEITSIFEERCGFAMVCGSFRRGDEKVGDIDLVIAGKEVDDIRLFEELGFEVEQTADDKMRRSYKLRRDDTRFPMVIDIWRAQPHAIGAATMYATGPGMNNVIMRRWAEEHEGLILDFGGVWRDGELIASETEEDCYRALDMKYVEPTGRTDYEACLGGYLDILNAE